MSSVENIELANIVDPNCEDLKSKLIYRSSINLTSFSIRTTVPRTGVILGTGGGVDRSILVVNISGRRSEVFGSDAPAYGQTLTTTGHVFRRHR